MKNHSKKQTYLYFLITGLLLFNTPGFAPAADSDSSSEQSATSTTTEPNPYDDQLALPITLKQFENLQKIVQNHTEETVKAIDTITKNTEEFTKNFNVFVEDLLKEPEASSAQ